MDYGILYVVSTPIGNLEDITLRALRVLKEVDFIASEDTRRTMILLQHYGINKKLLSYHEHNSGKMTDKLIKLLQEGKSVALVSDAGTPGVSDPGGFLVRKCRETGIKVIPVPGPSSIMTAISVSGINIHSFYFAGFLPSRGGERKKVLQELLGMECPVVFFESPHRVIEMLADLESILNGCEIVLFRELTKVHEEVLTGSPGKIKEILTQRGVVRGEFVVILNPQGLKESKDIIRIFEKFISSGFTTEEIIDIIKNLKSVSRNEVYRMFLRFKPGGKK